MKGKGKIHPSPSPSPPLAPGPEAVLALLPAAILALTAALGVQDREVLAYLLTRSIEAPAAAAEERQRHCRRPGGAAQHRPVFGCGCFDCYTGYWSRWDCSPDRELIHQAIEAFEEHLASSEKKDRARRRERKAAEKAMEEEKKKEKEKERAQKKAEKKREEEEAKKVAEQAVAGEEEKPAAEEEEEPAVEGEDEVAEEVAGERRRGWADVMGIFNSRLWGIWSPGA